MSLRARILLGMGAVVVLLLVAGAGLYRAQQSALLGQVDTRLETLRAQALTASMMSPIDTTSMRGQRALDGLYVGRLEAGAVLVTTRSAGDDPAAAPEGVASLAPGVPATVAASAPPGARMRVLVFTTQRGLTAVLGAPLDDIDSALASLRRGLLLVGLVLLAMIGLVTWWVMRLGVAPVTRVAQVARAVGGGDHEARVPDFPAGTEAQQLGSAFNLLVDENAQSQARLRQFVADASHELRTPLATLVGYTELLAAQGDEGDAVRRMRQEALRMQALVEDLLLLARADGGPVAQPGPVDVVPVVEGLVSDARVLAPDREIALQAVPVAIVAGNRDRIEQVVGNLLANARRHPPAGSAIEVAVTAVPDAWEIAVRDHGPGLSPQQSARVFDRFYRVDGGRQRAAGGTGLGLAIAAALTEAMGGQIGVESPADGGCRFWVRLPQAVETLPPPEG